MIRRFHKMLVSYCTTCHGRLWQLKQTLSHNLAFTKAGVTELCILIYNDLETRDFLERYYSQYISDGRLRVASYFEDRVFNDGSRWSCGYVKHLAHSIATGKALFNLDADNFIDAPLHEALLSLPDNVILITKQAEWRNDGRSGRIGVHRNLYSRTGYRDRGRNDDGDFMYRCFQLNVEIRQIPCVHPPISNEAVQQYKQPIAQLKTQ